MALREGRCLLARRFADRGNNRSMFVSRARGEDLQPVRRFADRGNDIVDSDPRDLKIWRLKQRVEGLEGSSTWKETEPENFVWDKLSWDEEHPTYGDTIYDSPPLYDQYGDDEWYSWFTSGDRNLYGKSSYKSHNDEVVTRVENGDVAVVPAGEEMAIDGPMMDEVGYTVVVKGGLVDFFGHSDWMKYRSSSKIQTNLLICCSDLNKLLKWFGYILLPSNIQIKDMYFKDFFSIYNGIYGDKNDLPNDDAFDGGTIMHIARVHLNIPKSTMEASGGLQMKLLNSYKRTSGPLEADFIRCETKGGEFTSFIRPIQVPVRASHDVLVERVRSMVNKRRFDAPFNLSDTNLKLEEMIREVSILRRDMMIPNKNRVDVPFDPGAFDLKAKLEDEFFFEEGEYDAGYLLI